MVNSRRGGRGTASYAPEAGKGGDGRSGKGGGKGGDYYKGAGKGEGKKGAAKGTGKGKKGEGKFASSAAPMSPERHVAGAKTVQELEAEMLLAKAGNAAKERREAVKQPLEAKGYYCEVKKHSDMGCAVVTFQDQGSRDAVMRLVEKKHEVKSEAEKKDKRPSILVSGVEVQCRPHFDKQVNTEVPSDIFVAWGRQEEKKSSLPANLIVEAMECLMVEARGGSPAGSPMLTSAAPFRPQIPMAPMQMPSSLQQMLQPPVVPGPQPMQQNYVEFMKYAWAQQQQQQQQQQHQQQAAMMQQQQPPPPPLPQSQEAPQTPPRQGNGKMRAEAVAFTPPALQQPQSFIDQSQYGMNELDQYANYNYNDMAAMQQPKKQFTIVDPKSGQAIDAPKQVPGFEPPMGRKPIKIVDPHSKETIDTLGMIFSPPKAAKSFSIIDPTSGSPVQMPEPIPA